MGKLYFKYGAMGSSKTANALMTKFNYEERGMKVALFKPLVDTRSSGNIVSSRIGLESSSFVFDEKFSFAKWFIDEVERGNEYDCIIIDEAQFCTGIQIFHIKTLCSILNVTCICYGLRTDFKVHLFEGSEALFRYADTIEEIKTMCSCGNKATINARYDENGIIVLDGEQIQIGGNESYKAVCFDCYRNQIELTKKYQEEMEKQDEGTGRENE